MMILRLVAESLQVAFPIKLELKKMLMERVGLMGGLLNSTKVITVAVVYFMAKGRISYQKTKYRPIVDTLR